MNGDRKRVLRLAYAALSGDFADNPPPYVRGVDLRDPHRPITRLCNQWLVPDISEDVPFLRESVCVWLEVRGLLECRRLCPGDLWLYRLTPEGCVALGRGYPVAPYLPGIPDDNPLPRPPRHHTPGHTASLTTPPARYRFYGYK